MDMRFNGTLLSDAVEGLKVLGTEGRHSVDIEATTKANITDGSELLNVRTPERTITVYVFIPADTAKELKEKYDALYDLLNQSEECKFIFSDEGDRYYKGIFISSSLVRSVKHTNTASFSILCVDPYKYAVNASTATYTTAETAEGDTVNVLQFENAGSVPCPAYYTITNNSDNGYISLVSEDGQYLVFGDTEEKDTEKATKSVMITKDKTADKIASDKGFAASDLSNLEFKYTSDSSVKVASIQEKDTYTVDSYGTMPSTLTDGYYGVARSYTIPSENVSASVTLGAHVTFCTNAISRKGLLAVTLNHSGQAIADLFLLKPYTMDLSGMACCRVRDTDGTITASQTVNFNMGLTAEGNPFNETSENPGYIEIRKGKDTIYFNVAGTEVELTNSDLKTVTVDSVTFWICKYNDATALKYLGFKDIFVRSDSVKYQKDIPNRYSDGDVLYINGEKGFMKKNGTMCNGDEILGSSYFLIPPGTHNVIVGKSAWADAVTATATFRPRWI